MKYFTHLLLVLALCWMCYGCVKKRLEPTRFQQIKEKAVRDSLEKLGFLVNANKISNNIQARKYARRAVALALQSMSEEMVVRAYLMMGITFFNFDNDSSFFYYLRALKMAGQNHLEELKPKLYYNLAMVYRDAYNTKMCAIYLDSSITGAQKIKRYPLLSDAYNALGNLQSTLRDTIAAKRMFDSAFVTARRYSLPKQMGIAMASLSNYEVNRDSSNALLKRAIIFLKRQPGNEEEIASILCNLGFWSRVPDSAIIYLKNAIAFAIKGNSIEIEIAAYNNLANSFMEKHQPDSAEKYLVVYGIPLARRILNEEWLSTLYDTYTDVLVGKKQPGKAIIYARKALESRDAADKKQAAGQVRLLAALLDVKNRELKIQTSEKELQRKEYKIHVVIFLFSISLLVVLIILFIFIVKYQRNRIKFQTDQLASAKRLIESEETLKGRVSMELHDLTTPFYTAMRQHIEEARIADQNIEEALKEKLSVMTKSIRQISHQMNNSFIEQLTISELVKGLCEDLKSTSPIEIKCIIEPKKFPLSGEETLHVYRIVQEILTNAIKYVSSGKVTISLSEEAGMFFIIYKDESPGFDKNTISRKGLGIMNIYERSTIIGGNAVLNTHPGKGTTWNINIPLKKTQNGITYESKHDQVVCD